MQGWDFAEELPNVKAYLHRMTGRASWRNSASWDDDCILADFKRKFEAGGGGGGGGGSGAAAPK